MPLYADDLIVRTSNDEPHKFQANSFATLDELADIVKFRLDAGVWDATSEDLRVKAAVAAYDDLNKLCWSTHVGLSQSKDYEFSMRYGVVNEPPLDLADFLWRVKKAQAVQAMFLLNGTQVRDMARDGIKWTRNLTGSDLEVTGYLGPVCAEAIEVLAPYLELMPRRRRF